MGVTNNLHRRVYEHKQHLVKGFTDKYEVTKLVCCEETSDVTAAIAREKQIKGWLRRKKMDLVESLNPTWKDLAKERYWVLNSPVIKSIAKNLFGHAAEGQMKAEILRAFHALRMTN